jgi:hypothetical protein
MAAPRAVHDLEKIIPDLAVMLALGGDCLADVARLRAEPALFGRDAHPDAPGTITGRYRPDPGTAAGHAAAGLAQTICAVISCGLPSSLITCYHDCGLVRRFPAQLLACCGPG